MGTFFPLGVTLVRERFPDLIPWGWAINSGFSVLGGTLSLFASMSWGYARTWYAFTLPYLAAAILLKRMASADRAARPAASTGPEDGGVGMDQSGRKA
jgi:hypothetical protein